MVPKLFLFAGDSLIFILGNRWQGVRTKAQMSFEKWLDQNVLSLDISKTKFLLISQRSVIDYYLKDLDTRGVTI